MLFTPKWSIHNGSEWADSMWLIIADRCGSLDTPWETKGSISVQYGDIFAGRYEDFGARSSYLRQG